MKEEVDSPSKVAAWLTNPRPAIFQGQDLREVSGQMAAAPLEGCVFLGCSMEPGLAKAVAEAGCLLMPSMAGLPFEPFTARLYTPRELYNRFDPDAVDSTTTYHECLDWLVSTRSSIPPPRSSVPPTSTWF